MSNKYWEDEEPTRFDFGKNVFQVYAKAGKIQVYKSVPSAPRGVSKGVTIEVDQMDEVEKEGLLKMVAMCLGLKVPDHV